VADRWSWRVGCGGKQVPPVLVARPHPGATAGRAGVWAAGGQTSAALRPNPPEGVDDPVDVDSAALVPCPAACAGLPGPAWEQTWVLLIFPHAVGHSGLALPPAGSLVGGMATPCACWTVGVLVAGAASRRRGVLLAAVPIRAGRLRMAGRSLLVRPWKGPRTAAILPCPGRMDVPVISVAGLRALPYSLRLQRAAWRLQGRRRAPAWDGPLDRRCAGCQRRDERASGLARPPWQDQHPRLAPKASADASVERARRGTGGAPAGATL
jgi:hypothetical protein